MALNCLWTSRVVEKNGPGLKWCLSRQINVERNEISSLRPREKKKRRNDKGKGMVRRNYCGRYMIMLGQSPCYGQVYSTVAHTFPCTVLESVLLPF